MALRIIGAGWGRTGTTTMKEAVGILGYRCHDMNDLFIDPTQASLFTEAAENPLFDWERIYGSYDATFDFPGCVFWRELATFYPEAKVILTVRPAAAYYSSYHATIEEPMTNPRAYPTWNEMVRKVIVPRAFHGDPKDRDAVMASFERHNAAVQEAIPEDRLLVYSVAEGWPSLCAFLGCPVPSGPFPRRNPRDEWQSHILATPPSSAKGLKWSVRRAAKAALGRWTAPTR